MIALPYLKLVKKHGTDELDHVIIRAFMNKENRLGISMDSLI